MAIVYILQQPYPMIIKSKYYHILLTFSTQFLLKVYLEKVNMRGRNPADRIFLKKVFRIQIMYIIQWSFEN